MTVEGLGVTDFKQHPGDVTTEYAADDGILGDEVAEGEVLLWVVAKVGL